MRELLLSPTHLLLVKRTVGYILFLLLSLAFNVETIMYYSQAMQQSGMHCDENMPLSEKESEPEETKLKKIETTLGHEFDALRNALQNIGLLYATEHRFCLLPGYTEQVFSPPELG